MPSDPNPQLRLATRLRQCSWVPALSWAGDHPDVKVIRGWKGTDVVNSTRGWAWKRRQMKAGAPETGR
jgi:hypothetical protein